MATGSVYFLAVDNKKLRRYRCASDGAADCCEISECGKERDDEPSGMEGTGE
jgi:hypothetical protein